MGMLTSHCKALEGSPKTQSEEYQSGLVQAAVFCFKVGSSHCNFLFQKSLYLYLSRGVQTPLLLRLKAFRFRHVLTTLFFVKIWPLFHEDCLY